MQRVEEQILAYPHLSAEKKREVETYVEEHPEWSALLEDVRVIESLAGKVKTESISDALVTTYVTVQRLHPESVPAGLEEAFRRLERELDGNPVLQEQVEAARDRLATAEAAVDPVAHFRELTGHALDADEKSARAEAGADDRDPVSPRSGASAPGIVDRLLRLPLALRVAGAAVALLLGAYATLFVASEASQSTLDRLAAVKVSNQVVDNYASTATRSAVPSPDTLTTDQLYVDALTAVRQARTSTLGLFPSYDSEKLDRAEQLLTQVLNRTEPESFLALETQFYLGKVLLAQGRVEDARSRFRTVVEREGRMAPEARDILDALRNEYPADETNAN
jgi:TolA-binding protein